MEQEKTKPTFLAALYHQGTTVDTSTTLIFKKQPKCNDGFSFSKNTVSERSWQGSEKEKINEIQAMEHKSK